eukprot:SAG25_NODE_6663_length_540_cov_0.918367_1_plen_67_part_10
MRSIGGGRDGAFVNNKAIASTAAVVLTPMRIDGNLSNGNLEPIKAPRLCSEETHCQSSSWPTEPPCA